MSSHADIAVSERPCLKQLSGRWTLDITQSESNDGVLAAMGCGFITRALLARLETRLELWQSPSSLLIRESTILGTYHSRELVTDGRWHEVAQLGGGLASVRATLSPTTGDVSIESSLSSGLLIEHFSLMRRIALGHVRDFFPGCAEVTAAMVPSASAVGVWTRDETDAERLAAEEAEAAAVQAAGVSAISLTLGYTAENGDENANVNKKKLIEKSHETNGPLSPPLSEVEEADFIPNFTGAWVVDTAASRDTLESILYLMGVPWLAVKVALSLNVVTVITHDVEGGNVTTEERTSLGVIARNTLHSDGITVPQKGADGRTAHITCTARAATPTEKTAGTLGALRIITELPDGLGTTDNTWFLRVNGLEMYQEISFTRGAKTVEAHRVLINRSTPPIAQREMQQNLSFPSLPIPLDSSDRTPITNDTVSTVSGDDADPFFVSLQGIWGGVGTAISDLARDLSANNSRGAATAANTLRRFATTETNKNLVIDHNHTSITFKNGPIGALMGVLPIPLGIDSKWKNGVKAYTIMGQAREKTWLGYEATDLPSDNSPFFLSSLPCNSATYTQAHIIIEKELVAGGTNKPWVLLTTIALDVIIPQLRIEFSIVDSREGRGGGGIATTVAMMSLNMPVDDVRAYVKEAGVRARHCRALIVARRGEADRRNAALIK